MYANSETIHSVITSGRQSRRLHRVQRSIEALEDRRVLSTISWDNRLFGDDFSVYGENEVVARQIVDRAIGDWERVITDFNFAGGGNTFHVNITAENGFCGSALTTDVDVLGKPTQANIKMEDSGCGGESWYFDPVIGNSDLPDDSDFSQFITPFSARRSGGDSRIDYYTAVLHEIGHALGINSGHPDLKIHDYLSGPLIDDPVNPSMPGDVGNNLYSVNIGGGPIEATMTDAGSGGEDNLFAAHLYEGPATLATIALGLPIHPDNVLNDGRTWNADRRVRRLIPDFTAQLLSDVYGYTIALPSNINTFYANLDTTTGVLKVRGDLDSAVDSIAIDEVANDIRAQVNGTSERIEAAAVTLIDVDSLGGGDSIQINATPVGIPTDVNSGSGDDVVSIANATGNLAFIDGDVTVNGSGGNDILNIQDLGHTSDQWYIINSSTITPVGLGFSIDFGPTTEIVFLNGDQGNSRFDIEGVGFGKTFNVLGQGGDDVFDVGANALPTLDGIDGLLVMNGGADSDSVTFDDGAHIGSETYTLTDVNLTRTGIASPLVYTNMEDVALLAGQFDDIIQVESTGDLTTINGNTGSDTIVVGDGDIDSNILDDIMILGGAGLGPNDHLILDDQLDANNDNYFLTDTTFNKFNFLGTLTYDSSVNILTLDANDQNNTVFVDATPVDTQVNINGRDGNDRVVVGNGDIDTNIRGDVSVQGGSGNDDLLLSDSLDGVGNDTYTLTATTFDKTSYAGTLDYSFIEAITLDANGFDNAIDIDSTSPTTPITVDGNDGTDTFNVNAPPSSMVTLNGGDPVTSPGDSMTVIGTPTSVGTYLPSSLVPGEGIVEVDGQLILFTGLEPITASVFDSFTLMTPNSDDQLSINEVVPGQNIITGSSGGVAFESLSFFDITRFIVDMAANDVATAADRLTLSAGDMPASGVELLVVNAGIGSNLLLAASGVTNVNTDVGVGGINLDVIVRGASTRVNFLQSQFLQSLSLISGALVSLEPNGAETVLYTTDLSIDGGATIPSSTLDLHDNGLIIDYALGNPSPYAVAKTQIAHAFSSVPAWDGPGITSSLAESDPVRFGVGYAEAADVTNEFFGVTVDDTAVLVRTTLLGDATLDGVVDGFDLLAWNGHNFGAGDWAQGDFNYDGNVDGQDYVQWNNNKFQVFEARPRQQPPSTAIPPVLFNRATAISHAAGRLVSRPDELFRTAADELFRID